MSDTNAVLIGGASIDDREQKLADGADALAKERTGIAGRRDVLLLASGALVTAGITVIVLGWVGASRSTLIEEQVPYLISGGLLGLALAVVGAMTYFAHWLTVLVQEARAQEAARARDHQELMQELRAQRDAPQEESNGTARSGRRQRSVRGTASRS